MAATAIALLLAGCGAKEIARPDEGRHLTREPTPAAAIPAVVKQPPLIVPPEPEPKQELYTVVVHDVPVRELLFALARDARLNMDIHPDVGGKVTLNAVDQTLPQILNRIARQVDLRYEMERPNLLISPDRPFLRSYKIDYVNMVRKTTDTVSVATQIATTGSVSGAGANAAGGASGGSNNSVTTLTKESSNLFWDTLVQNIQGIIGVGGEAGGAEGGGAANTVLVNRESGLITVRATGLEHGEIRKLVDQVMNRAEQQVLIEATIVEVELSNQYQAGVDWTLVDDRNTTVLNQQLIGTNFQAPPVTTLTLGTASSLNATIKLLEQFGDLKVLSSPKIMALNNQTALLKVVDNKVYFTINVDITPATTTSAAIITYESNVNTVPVGFVMAVTPQISDASLVTLNVRPTISRILGYVKDPSPALAAAGVESKVPEIQVREMESVLKVASGQIAVLGGLMQDTVQKGRSSVPGFSEIPLAGDFFSFRNDQVKKTELVIFLRPTVIRNASIHEDMRSFRNFMPSAAPVTN